MRPTALVVSSVHPPDDPRIRHKLVETLRHGAYVRLAIRAPGPEAAPGLEVDLLRGGRLARTLAASRLILSGDYDVASVHDPELLPAAMLAAMLGNRVVFDVHENIPAQLAAKPWMPKPLQGVAKMLARFVLQIAERVLQVTLAEPNYAAPFNRAHPVFPNYLGSALPAPAAEPGSGAVYLGDITEVRGLLTAVEAVGASHGRPHLTLIGRCAPEFRAQLEREAAARNVDLRMTGFLTPDRALALASRHAVALSPLHDVPNYRDSLPTKLLEYLALGLPVVASDLPGGRRELAGAPGVVWVAPGDAAALAAGINTVFESEALQREAREGAQVIRSRYRWPEAEVRRFYLETG